MREDLIAFDQAAFGIVNIAIDPDISAIGRIVNLTDLPKREIGRLDVFRRRRRDVVADDRALHLRMPMTGAVEAELKRVLGPRKSLSISK